MAPQFWLQSTPDHHWLLTKLRKNKQSNHQREKKKLLELSFPERAKERSIAPTTEQQEPFYVQKNSSNSFKNKTIQRKRLCKRKTKLSWDVQWPPFMLSRWHNIVGWGKNISAQSTFSFSSSSSCLVLLASRTWTRVSDGLLSFCWSSQAKVTKSPPVSLDFLFSLASLPCTPRSLLRRGTGPRNGQAGPANRFANSFCSKKES